MAKMTDSELIATLSQAEEDAAIYTSEFMRDNEKYLNGYFAKPTGDFTPIENQSSVVSTDIADVVESDMPSLMRIFYGSGDIIKFQPNTENEQEIAEADEKTKYINWLVRNQKGSFKLIHDWLKDAEIQKGGVVKYFIDDKKEIEEREFKNVDESELGIIIDSLKTDGVAKVDVVEQEENEDGTFNIKFRATVEKQETCIINVPTESFLITRAASCVEDAELVGDKIRKTRGELLADGFKRELVDQLTSVEKAQARNTQLNSIRNRDQGGNDTSTEVAGWANEYVEISDLYVRVDFDGDGIAERRHVMISGNKVLVNEAFNHVPYAMLSAILMPHKAIGRSRAEITYETQRQKTALIRGIHNNIHMVNNPRNVVHDDVDLDDMLTVRTNGIVRLDSDSKVLPQQAVFPLTTPYIGDAALQVVQYTDQARAQTSGTFLANQGLDSDSIAKETATRFEGIKEKGGEKVELIARNYAETGFRKLFEGLAWLASRYQNSATEFMVLGKALTVDPSKWRFNHQLQANVGLGAGDNEKLVASLQGIAMAQSQMIQAGSTLADEKKLYNTWARITDGLGLPRTNEFFNDPEEPEETLKAENEILNKMVVQLQEQMQVLQAQVENPLAEAEMVKREGDIAIAQGKLQLEAAKLEEDKRQFNIDASQKANKQSEDVALEITKLELDNNTDLPGGL